MKLRKATYNDWKILFSWRNDKLTRKNFLNTNKIKDKEHKKWLEETLENPYRLLLIAMEKLHSNLAPIPVGTVRIDVHPFFTQKTESADLSWTVAPEFRKRGLGKKMVKKAIQYIKSGKIYSEIPYGIEIKMIEAEIKRNNIASQKIAEHAGLQCKILYYKKELK